MQEVVGVNENASKVFANVLPIMSHHVCIDFGISRRSYRNMNETLGETG